LWEKKGAENSIITKEGSYWSNYIVTKRKKEEDAVGTFEKGKMAEVCRKASKNHWRGVKPFYHLPGEGGRLEKDFQNFNEKGEKKEKV